ncbi:hypothetical protein VMCG_06121 [Cytospora schulzeri]|uniref:Uncharacterized protein n=1 Tax=Cytospora schulzeri TaxID=448051 RepID=A0A423WGG1_9PEZI|nr:hypothetical protein VMCG_06121 [Valsa malicola]
MVARPDEMIHFQHITLTPKALVIADGAPDRKETEGSPLLRSTLAKIQDSRIKASIATLESSVDSGIRPCPALLSPPLQTEELTIWAPVNLAVG